MRRIGVFIDVSNIYFCVAKTMKAKLNYRELMNFIEPIGTVTIANAYGAQVNHEAKPFITFLKSNGFVPKYKEPKFFNGRKSAKADWDVGIAVDIIRSLDAVDIIIIGTADGDMAPVVEYAMEHGKEVIIIGAGISSELSIATSCIEIPWSMVTSLDDKEEGANT